MACHDSEGHQTNNHYHLSQQDHNNHITDASPSAGLCILAVQGNGSQQLVSNLKIHRNGSPDRSIITGLSC